MSNDIYNKFNGISDEEWLELLIRADKQPYIDGVKMPSFPSLEFQKNSVGMNGPEDLRYEAFEFTSEIKQYANNFGINNADTNLLDFGTGWGRLIRFFFKDYPSENIFGIDTWDNMINCCNDLLPAGNYSINTPLPPTNFKDNTFDIIFAYSVFSHLRHDAAEEWIKEFSRILRPNGIVVATTQGTLFLNIIESLKKNLKKRRSIIGLSSY